MRAALGRLVDASMLTLVVGTPLAAVSALVTWGGFDAYLRGLAVVGLACAGPVLAWTVRGGK